MEQPAARSVPTLHAHHQLRTIDCIAQALAVGPIFSAGALGAALAAVSGGVGPFVILIATIGCLGLGYLLAQTAKRFTGSAIVYEYVTNLIGRRTAVFSSGCYFGALTFVLISTPIVGAMFANNLLSANLGFELPWWVLGLIITVIVTVITLLGVQASVKS
ncbi:MAG: hypothetical protein M1565_05995, partial [Actinobacteria bacterium]|nr:hypothetical protein [Actinomycetota bacterium]